MRVAISVASLAIACGGGGAGGNANPGNGGSANAGSGGMANQASGGMANAASGGAANAMPGCGTPGWLTENFGWDAFRISGAAGGVGICHPSTWTSAAAASQVTLTRSDATTITTIIISAGGGTYANMLKILTDNDAAWCTYTDYMAAYVAVDGFPALDQRFQALPAVCGACGGPVDLSPEQHVVLDIASDGFVVYLRSATQHVSADTVAEVAAIERTATLRGVSRPPDVEADLGKLRSDRSAACRH